MKTENIIRLLEAGQEELAKQFLRGNQDLIPEVARVLLQMKKTGATLFTDGIERKIYYKAGESILTPSFFGVPYSDSVAEAIETLTEGWSRSLTHTQDLALTTPHNIRALFQAWLEDRSLEAEEFDWTVVPSQRRLIERRGFEF